ncbi:MAG: hypothetical protein HFE63_03000 [Clostridiales bacterium]|nr:hypothetical protein [Clostridiales bacterium]
MNVANNNARSLRMYSLPFAAWELRLYLDTHPDDTKALEAYKQICATVGGCNYACATEAGKSAAIGRDSGDCGCGCGGSSWTWVDGPWPWEPEANIVESED